MKYDITKTDLAGALKHASTRVLCEKQPFNSGTGDCEAVFTDGSKVTKEHDRVFGSDGSEDYDAGDFYIFIPKA